MGNGITDPRRKKNVASLVFVRLNRGKCHDHNLHPFSALKNWRSSSKTCYDPLYVHMLQFESKSPIFPTKISQHQSLEAWRSITIFTIPRCPLLVTSDYKPMAGLQSTSVCGGIKNSKKTRTHDLPLWLGWCKNWCEKNDSPCIEKYSNSHFLSKVNWNSFFLPAKNHSMLTNCITATEK
jgi:hypothetical protein